MSYTSRCGSLSALAVAAAALLSACSSQAPYYPPVEDRGIAVSRAPAATSSPAADDYNRPAVEPRLLPGAENAGKPGYYTVRPGDTLIRLGLETGQNWKDLARWNNLENPNLIEVGQVLRIIPPLGMAASPIYVPAEPAPAVAVSRPVTSSTVTGTPTKPAKAAASSATTSGSTSTAASATSASTAANSTVLASDDDPAFIWPSNGPVLANFDEAKNKGVDIGGKAGDPVLAAAPGRVVYAGSGLRGYGNLVIIKHNTTFLTAYAHNQSLLVKEDQTVRKGQKIAEMGSSDADRTKLHFEVRRQGKPVDPTKYLPAR